MCISYGSCYESDFVPFKLTRLDIHESRRYPCIPLATCSIPNFRAEVPRMSFNGAHKHMR
jgi:hypothetical protein